MANLSDQVEQLTRIVVRMHQGDRATRLRQASGQPASRIAKLAGATPEAVYSWEQGTVQPSTQQALAWLGALYDSSRTDGQPGAPVQAAESRG